MNPIAYGRVDYQGKIFEVTQSREVAYSWPESQHIIPMPLYSLKELSEEKIWEIIKQQDWFSMSWVDMVRRIEKEITSAEEVLKSLEVPENARQKLHELQVKKCGNSYDTVCPPSICDCRKK